MLKEQDEEGRLAF